MSKVTKAILVSVALVIASVGGTLAVLQRKLQAFAEAPFAEPKAPAVRLEIPRGASTQAVGGILEKAGVVKNGRQFYLYVRFIARADTQLKPGEYDLSPSLTPAQVLARLIKGDVVTYKFTIPEGSNLKDIARIIAASGLVKEDDLRKLMWDPAFARELGIPPAQDHLEGYLFPDTYRFAKGVTAAEILKHLRSRTAKALTPEVVAKGKALNLDPHQILTLASIVEKETGAPEERPRISAVFHNRMRRGIKLQTDPTVIYGIPDYSGNITKADLERPTPYNTYVIPALPPGPIASPGMAAIQAAVEPAETKVIFFVSMNNGTHVFCETLACHEENVKKWQVDFFRKGKKE